MLGRKIVGSINKVTAEQNKAKREFWANVEVGKSYTGVIRALTSYKVGTFVDIGGVEAACATSSEAELEPPSSILRGRLVGDTISVIKRTSTPRTYKGFWATKKAGDNPWEQLKNNCPSAPSMLRSCL